MGTVTLIERIGIVPTWLVLVSSSRALNSRIFNFATEARSKQNAILDRCRVIKGEKYLSVLLYYLKFELSF